METVSGEGFVPTIRLKIAKRLAADGVKLLAKAPSLDALDDHMPPSLPRWPAFVSCRVERGTARYAARALQPPSGSRVAALALFRLVSRTDMLSGSPALRLLMPSL